LLPQPACSGTGRICLLDVNEGNTGFCLKWFAGIPAVAVYRNTGHDLQPIGNAEATAIFCYGATVLFKYSTVVSCIKDASGIRPLAAEHYSTTRIMTKRRATATGRTPIGAIISRARLRLDGSK
jgi:hypothetical protein